MKLNGVFVLLLFITVFITIWKVYDPLLSRESRKREQKDCGGEKCSWFMQHYQSSVSSFLTSKYNLSEEDFNWWRKIQLEKHDLNFFKKTTQKIFEMFPQNPPVAEPAADVSRKCAVVGNSGNLRRSHYGKCINQHDSVFRINYGKTEGYEEDVGTKTTHRVMYPESATDLDNTTHLVLVPFKIQDLQWLLDAFTTGSNAKSYAPIKKRILANKNLVMVVNPAFIKYVHESWLQNQGSYPSTGFMTVVLTLHICDKVSVFGFGADSNGKWSHYWDEHQGENFKKSQHPASAEYDMIVELAKHGKVAFYWGR